MTSPSSDHQDHYYAGSSYADRPAAHPRPIPRRSRRGRYWLIALAVLVALLVGADRVAAAVTEDRLAAKIQQTQHLSRKPSVSIGGFPFLTQVVSRHFGHATVDIDDFDSGSVPIAHIHADLRAVSVSSSYDRATVETLTGTATLDYTQVSQVLSRNISNIGQLSLGKGAGDQVEARYQLLGAAVSADVAVNVLGGDVIEFKTVKVNTPLSGLGIGTPTGFDVKIPLTALPFGMRLSGVQVMSTGVDVSVTGTNVVLTGSGVGASG